MQGANTEEAKRRGDSISVVEKTGEMRSAKVKPQPVTGQPITGQPVPPVVQHNHNHNHNHSGLLVLVLNTALLIWILTRLRCCKQKEANE